ncbi:MAG: UPF0182 family protein, partial [Nitrospinales bacterium]
ARVGFGLFTGVLFFGITFSILKRAYAKTSHLPVTLSEATRREVPILDLIASNLKPLVFLGPLVVAAMTGWVAAQKWELVLKYLNQVSFNQADPIFGNDVSFYIFTLPLLTTVLAILWEALVVTAVGVGMIYFFKGSISLTAAGLAVRSEARRAISLVASFAFLLIAAKFYLERFDLLTQQHDVMSGVTYADDHGRIPVLNASVVLALLGSAVSFVNIFKSDFRQLFLAAGVLGVGYLGGNFYPSILQKFVVAPNELIKETPYIEHTIAATNRAFGLDKTETNEMSGSFVLTAETIKANRITLDNIRLWDSGPLLDTLGQIQEIRTYYQFAAVDNDRYQMNGAYRQTLLSPRELDSTSLPNRTWINEHLTFTHGYGVALSPVHQVSPEGLPVLLIKDIPPQSSVSLTITRPEIYFGELTNDYVFVNTDTKEFDYPEGEKNVYKNYEGKGGVPVASFFRKLLLSAHLKTMKTLFSEDIHEESRVLLYRNITDRLKNVAPFLKLDRDPYLVISEGRLQWIYDAYTISDQYPYSQPLPGFGNYVRNSVKVVIDAYNGSMDFYIADLEDPIILTYRGIFPTLFKNLEEMPVDLKRHIRYPVDLFTIQTFIYSTYHMKTPQVFYNKEDQWEIPEIDNELMQPYYTIMKLPGKEREEYILMLPFTPQGKSNLSAWMVARSDGEHFGKLAVYTFPKQRLVYGPNQIVARINQNAEVSRQISLWDQRGSNVIQGNLLVIPIEEALIYVRPLYLKADAGKIPELKRVIVGYEDRIAMEPTLNEALKKIFTGLDIPSAHEAPRVAGAEPSASAPVDSGRVVLKRSDFDKIKSLFQKAMDSQKRLEQTLEDYRGELEELGTSLNGIQIFAEEKTPAAKKNVQ